MNCAMPLKWWLDRLLFPGATFALPVEVAITKKMLDQTLDTSLYKAEWKRWCNGQTCSWVWLFSPGFKKYATLQVLQLFCKKRHGFSLTLVRKTFKMFIYPVIPRASYPGYQRFFLAYVGESRFVTRRPKTRAAKPREKTETGNRAWKASVTLGILEPKWALSQ